MKTFELFKTRIPANSDVVLPLEMQTIQQWKEENGDMLHSNDSRFKIIWITNGSGEYFIDMHNNVFQSDQVLCMKPRQPYKLIFTEDTSGYIISFTDNFLNVGELEFDLTCQVNLFQLFSKSCGITIKEDMIDDMKEIVTRMIREFDNIYLFKTEILKRYLKILLIYITRQFNESFTAVAQTRNNELVQKFMNQLDTNFKLKKMVSDYAGTLCVTPNYLNEIVKKITGYSAGYHIRQRIVLEAKRMALYSDNSMKEIAYELGFLDCAHFSKFFKSITGSNFTEFKKEKLTVAVHI
ncbi:MAG: helix-turn-helix transcriptional regulator [Ginsengibacter sp.]